MMALVDDESILGDVLGVDIVGVKEVDELRLGRRGLLRWDEAYIICGRPGGNLYKIQSEPFFKL